MYVSITTIWVIYLIIGAILTIGEMKAHPPLKDVFVIVASFLIFTICWIPFLIIRAIWGKERSSSKRASR